MKLRIGNIMFLLFLSSVAFPQATNRYLDKPCHKNGKKMHKFFSKYCRWMTNGESFSGCSSRFSYFCCGQTKLLDTDRY